MTKKNLNEEALKTNLDVEYKDELVGTTTPAYIQAIRDHRKAKDNLDEIKKDKEEKAKRALDTKGKIVRNEGSNKMHLSENLFESKDVDVDDDLYSFIMRELFNEGYRTLKGMGLSQYNVEAFFSEDDLSREQKEKGGVKDTDYVIGVYADGETEDERKADLKSIHDLANMLGLTYKSLGHHKRGFLILPQELSERDGIEYAHECGIKTVDTGRGIEKEEETETDTVVTEGYIDPSKVVDRILDSAKADVVGGGVSIETAIKDAIKEHLTNKTDILAVIEHLASIDKRDLMDSFEKTIEEELTDVLKKELKGKGYVSESKGKKLKESAEEKIIFTQMDYDYDDRYAEVDINNNIESIDGVIDGGSDYMSFGDEELVKIANGSYYDYDKDENGETIGYDYEVLDELKKVTGKEYDEFGLSGYSQGEWATLYAPKDTRKEIIDEIDNLFFGKYEVYEAEDEEPVRVPHDVTWKGTKEIKEYIADFIGYVDPSKIVIRKLTGYTRTPNYEEE